jgi:hypothetical protein
MFFDLTSSSLKHANPIFDLYISPARHDEVEAFVRTHVPILDESGPPAPAALTG